MMLFEDPANHTQSVVPTGAHEDASTLYASFASLDQAVKAAGALLDHGVRPEDVSVIGPGTEAELARLSPGHDKHGQVMSGAEVADSAAKHGISVTTAGDAAVGAAKGAGVGLGVGLAVGLAALVVPGVGIVLGAGALATALAGAALTTGAGAVAGGVTGYLKDQGVPDDVVATYTDAVTEGGSVVSVSLPSNEVGETYARDLLAKYDAKNLAAYGLAA